MNAFVHSSSGTLYPLRNITFLFDESAPSEMADELVAFATAPAATAPAAAAMQQAPPQVAILR